MSQKLLTRLMIENVEATVTPLPGGAYFQKLQEVVGGARYSVDVIQYNWNFMPFSPEKKLQQFNQHVIKQIRKGVKYRVLMNSKGLNLKGSKTNQAAKRHLENAGAKVKVASGSCITHAKLFIVDDQFVILGSHNLSTSSVERNDETSILVNSREVAMEYKRYFNLIWERS